ncbi:hypothetical protein ACH3XW_49235 [Acanthocheilonema viteae]|uniref:Uncharacterized protein n=1 Tax=Acanthocheilonema viteae TaxID=6277 RepID=A0A498SCP6_ACAVI|nr:unnamed protein product [Acanthocheilonema viteae]
MLPRNLQALRDRKNNWSLAEDRQLCSVLEEIKSSLTIKINNISDAIQENSLKITNACVQVSNLNNRLSLFAADQFIESRVADDVSVCVDPTPTSQEVIQNKQTEKTDNLRQAVSMGLELMRTHFKRIDIRPEDLDEDDDPICIPAPVFEPYDENLSRPLPFLIGSSEWKSSPYASSSEECAEIAKVTEEVVISLPPFIQPKMAECRGLSYTNTLDGKFAYMTSNQATSNINGVEAKIASCSNEYRSETYTPQEVIATSSSQNSLLKEKEVENTADFTSDLSRNRVSRRYPELPVVTRNPEVSVGHSGSEVSRRPPDMEVSTRLPKSEIPVKRVSITDTIENQAKGKTNEGASNAMGNLFIDSSSDEDDLFSDLKNTIVETKQHISTYSNDSQIISTAEKEKTDLQTDMNVRSSDVFADVLKPKNSLEATDYIFANNEQTSDTFRNKLDSILSSKIMSDAISGLGKRQEKEIVGEKIKDDGTNAVLPFLAKLRAKGPPRRSPSHLLENSGKNSNKDEVRSVHSSIATASAEDNRTIGEIAEMYKERQDGQLKIDLEKRTTVNVNSLKQRNDINSIFSSDSDDDIFSTFSSRSETNAFVSKLHTGNNGVQSLPSSGERSLITSVSRSQTAKTDCKLKNLFDSDNDLFASSISVKKQEQESARDKEATLTKVIQEAIIPKKNGSVLEKKETVVPGKKINASKAKRVDIFGDDSDSDIFI